MNIDAEKMEKQEMNLPYEQPILKKYGMMKELIGKAGSGGDSMGSTDGTPLGGNVSGGTPPNNDTGANDTGKDDFKTGSLNFD